MRVSARNRLARLGVHVYLVYDAQGDTVFGAVPGAVKELRIMSQPLDTARLTTLTSALPSMSHPVASDRDLIRKSGVLPMQPSMPRTMCSWGAARSEDSSANPAPLRSVLESSERMASEFSLSLKRNATIKPATNEMVTHV